MKYDQISSLIVNESGIMVYISDPETYEIVYLNKELIDNFGICDGYVGKKCYKVLQGLDEPCPFCTNKYLAKDRYYVWKHYNPVVNQHYELRDKLVEIDGRDMRMELCANITETETEHQNLERQLSIEETLVECIHTLSENTDIDTAINKLLEIIGEFYQADCAYIFEINHDSKTITNTYEWCAKNIQSQISNLQELPLEVVERWMQEFKEKIVVYIDSLSEEITPETREYQILSKLGIKRLMAAPIIDNGEIIGFIGVDNPRCGKEQMKLLASITYFIMNDITKRHMLTQFQKMSYKDALTGLGNRNMYIETVERIQSQKLKSLGIVFVDINGLKNSNDQYGHEYGDTIIRNVADGLREIFPENSYRIGGDEFVCLYINGGRKQFEDRLLQLRVFEKEGCICDFSVGVNYSEENVDVKEQIGYSDNMMYVEKQIYYGNVISERNSYHEALAREFVRDIERGAFEVYLQPKVRLDTGRTEGAEALVRKKMEKGEVLMPEHFIPLYEAEGVIQYLDLYVFEEVCSILAKWKEEGCHPIPISVNFSRISLMGMDIADRLYKIRESYGVAPGLIPIEVTESISQIGTGMLKQLMKKLRDNGFCLCLDDYGAKYSNLALLTQVEFDELKLDQSLVNDIVHNEKARVVMQNSIQMCHNLGNMMSVAEGVETEEQLELLKKYHCDIGQGYLFSSPLSAQEFQTKFIKCS